MGGVIKTAIGAGFNGKSMRNVIVWGTVKSTPKLYETGKGRYNFFVQIRKNTDQAITVWSDNKQAFEICGALERGDDILIAGCQTEDGKYNTLTADLIIPQAALNAAINNAYGNPAPVMQQPEEPEEDPYEDFSAVDDFADEMPFR